MKKGLSRAQQGQFQPIRQRAWRAILRDGRAGYTAGKEAEDAWYRAELAIATGQTSTKDLDPARGFERACAHFEAMAGDAFEWQLKAENGDENRVRHVVERRAPGFLRRHFGGNRSFREYLLGIARQATGRPDIAQLRQLTDAQMATVCRAMVTQAERGLPIKP